MDQHLHPPFPSMPFMAGLAPLLQLFQGLPRRGPGSEASTLRALGLCPLPDRPVVADLGCGAGASTLLLAQALQVPILALDADGLALDLLWETARERGLSRLVQARCGDMADPGIPAGSLDLLWSEGSISPLGWARGLGLWRELVRPQGLLALTEATWLSEDPPEEARMAWESWLPGMGTLAGNLRIARGLGLGIRGHFTLPASDWWAYFGPVEARCDRLSDRKDLEEIIAGMREEIDLYRRFGHSYGYVFYVMERL